jgi:hypothetical protein
LADWEECVLWVMSWMKDAPWDDLHGGAVPQREEKAVFVAHHRQYALPQAKGCGSTRVQHSAILGAVPVHLQALAFLTGLCKDRLGDH